MKTLLILAALALLGSVHCVVDRTYFNYLGKHSLIQD